MLMMIAADKMTILDLKQNYTNNIYTILLKETHLGIFSSTQLTIYSTKTEHFNKKQTSYSLQSTATCVSVKLIIIKVYLKYCWGPKPC